MSKNMERLIGIMARLRDPDCGCPWDLQQTFATIAPHTIEEAYEVADAIEHGDMEALKDELGDLLFQVVFYAQMAQEDGTFDFDGIVGAICEKMERRHPHVFGDTNIADADAQTKAWEAHKAEERQEKAEKSEENGPDSALSGVTRGLPALTRALKLQKRAARVGFDWDQPARVLDKITEEINEIAYEINNGGAPARIEDELGDVLFVVANLARKLDVDPEQALRKGNDKFERRFRKMESLLTEEGKSPEQVSLDHMEALWQKAKKALG